MSAEIRPSCVACASRSGAVCVRLDFDLRDHLALGARPEACPGYEPTERARLRLAMIDLDRAVGRLQAGDKNERIRSARSNLRARLDDEDEEIAGDLPTRLGARLRAHARRLLERANSGRPSSHEERDEAERTIARYLVQWAREVEAGDWVRWAEGRERIGDRRD